MATTFHCPFCGPADQQDNPICPRCGRSLVHGKECSNDERLLLPLHHPIPELWMDPILISGGRRYERAVPVFAEMTTDGHDLSLLREAARAPAKIRKRES